MELKTAFFLLLWDLAFFVHAASSSCNVSCSTDYSVSLNCSCPGSVAASVLLSVTCSDGELEVNGTCEVTPPQSWCVMYPEMLEDVASIGTLCTASVSQPGDQVMTGAGESSTWALSDVVKPLPPFDVQVRDGEGFYNISWDHENHLDCLTYRVRIRESEHLSEDPVHSLSLEQKHIRLDQLQPHANFTVDVQAKMCPGFLYEGPWSEWSSTAQWRTAGPAEVEGSRGWESDGTRWCLLYVSLPITSVLGFLVLLHCLQKHFRSLKRKIELMTFIPKPDVFFHPLYHSYGGNFKEWVKPVFSEFDYLRIGSPDLMKSEKLCNVPQCNNDQQSYKEDQFKPIGHLLPSNSLLLFQDGSGSSGAGRSSGPLSIHSVTLSGQEELEENVVPRNPFRSFQDGQRFRSFRENNREQASNDLEQQGMLAWRNGELPHQENQIPHDLSEENVPFQPHVPLIEPERLSLDSFGSIGPSEDGYPHMDLDTIDSGFGECGCPGVSDSKQRHSFHEQSDSSSNYVKQWSGEEFVGTSESELNETD